jgi:Ricin-type beta-trefoil lectin domain-like
VVLAGIAAVTYAVMFHSASPTPSAALPTRVVTVDTVGLAGYAASPGARSGELVQLLAQQARLGFFDVSAAENASGEAPWTVNLLSGGTYIFIDPSTGQCLAAEGTAQRPALAVRHCEESSPQQRWERAGTLMVQTGHDFYELENVGDGKCISQTGVPGDPGSAGLASCQTASHPTSELLAFWWTTTQQ